MSDTYSATPVPASSGRRLLPLVILALATAGLLLWTSRTPETLVEWRDDLEAAQEQARRENRLVLLEFDAVGCGYCRQMDGEVFSRPEVLPLLEDFIPVRLDMNRDRANARRFRVEAVPAILVLSPSGRVMDSFVGARSFQDFRKFIEAIRS